MPKEIIIQERRDDSPPIYIPLSSNAPAFEEGDDVEVDDMLGVVTEVQTGAEFEGPDGEMYDPSEDSPVYIVAVEDADVGSIAATEAELTEAELPDTEGTPDDLAKVATNSELTINGPLDFDWPPSWEDSERPARIIALDVWSSMGGQFDCSGGGCCKGTMRQSGMSERASDQFCAALKDRILGWEGWRKGG